MKYKCNGPVSRPQACGWRTNTESEAGSRGTSNAGAAPAAVSAQGNRTDTYTYTYKVKPTDLWQVRMYYAYASYLAMVNIIAIFASVALLIAFWRNGAPWVRLVLLLFLSLFTVIQPLYIYYDCNRQLKAQGEIELTLTFNDRGLTILTGGKTEKHPWRDIINVSVKPTLIVIYTGQSQGYILTNRVLGETRKGFLSFLREERRKAQDR